MHGPLILLLSNIAAVDARRSAQVAAAEASQTAQRVAQTQARDLRHRVERMEAIRRELDPAALAVRAQALSDAIDAADRATRATEPARLTALTPDEARRKLAFEDATQKLAPPPDTAPQKIARLERRARDVAEARRARLDAQREGLRVTSVQARAKAPRRDAPDQAPLPTAPASGSTGQAHVADGIPRSAAAQLAAMTRLGARRGAWASWGPRRACRSTASTSRALPEAATTNSNRRWAAVRACSRGRSASWSRTCVRDEGR